MTNTMTDRRTALLRVARCGALAGRLAACVSDERVYARVREDWRFDFEEQAARGTPLPSDHDALFIYEQAFETGRDRARCRDWLAETHLTAPAARARA